MYKDTNKSDTENRNYIKKVYHTSVISKLDARSAYEDLKWQIKLSKKSYPLKHMAESNSFRLAVCKIIFNDCQIEYFKY